MNISQVKATQSDQSVPYTIHNNIQLLRGGHDYFELLQSMVDKAVHSIYLQTYIFNDDPTGRLVSSALQRAARRGIYVHLLVDGYASQQLPSAFIQQLKESGVHFRWFEPVFRSRYFYMGRRLHHKALVVDGRFGLVGGMNISDRYNDTPEHAAWLDWALYVEGEVSRALYNICAARSLSAWKLGKGQKIPPAPAFQLPSGESLARVRVNDWVRSKKEITNSYTTMLRQAEEQVTIMSSYFLPGYHIRRHLTAAARRGIRIRLILAGVSDVKLAKYAERYMYRWLLKDNIEIYEYHRKILHGKIAVADHFWLTVGSYNVNNISAYASIELNLEVMNKDLATLAEQALETILEKDCTRITEKDIKSSDFFTRMLQRNAYMAFRIMFFLFTFYFKPRE